MQITCNGEKLEVQESTYIIQLIKDHDLDPDFVVVELDGKILQRQEYDSSKIKDGSVVELVRFVGGG